VTDGRRWLDAKVAGRLMAQPLVTRFAMIGTVSGHHKSPHRGSSVEFAEYRNYAPGDDIRRLDWRVFGRTDRFYLKEFEAETNLRAYLVLDCSGSMKFAGKGESRFDYARRLIATLSYLIIQQGDAVGLHCVTEKKSIELPAKRTPSHVQLILNTLDQVSPSGETGLSQALHELAEKVRSRALVIVFSDCFTDPEPLLDAFRHVRFQKHDLAIFHLLDRQEVEFNFDRPLRFLDLEGQDSIITEPSVVRDDYLREMNRFLERMREGCHEFRAEYRRAFTDQSYERTLGEFLVERARLADAR
jgi:uncharacterized protein (DUF58 family)